MCGTSGGPTGDNGLSLHGYLVWGLRQYPRLERTRPMPDLIGHNPTMKLLERSLDLMAQRHQVLLGNVANEETPRFKAKDLEFQAVLASIGQPGAGALPVARSDAAPHPRHLLLPGQSDGTSPPVLKELPQTSFGLDKNTV